eukprot:366430-Chlamydomonas_euryale.AAC.1
MRGLTWQRRGCSGCRALLACQVGKKEARSACGQGKAWMGSWAWRGTRGYEWAARHGRGGSRGDEWAAGRGRRGGNTTTLNSQLCNTPSQRTWTWRIRRRAGCGLHTLHTAGLPMHAGPPPCRSPARAAHLDMRYEKKSWVWASQNVASTAMSLDSASSAGARSSVCDYGCVCQRFRGSCVWASKVQMFMTTTGVQGSEVHACWCPRLRGSCGEGGHNKTSETYQTSISHIHVLTNLHILTLHERLAAAHDQQRALKLPDKHFVPNRPSHLHTAPHLHERLAAADGPQRAHKLPNKHIVPNPPSHLHTAPH